MQNEILEQLDKVIEYYNDMQSDSPDNLSLPNFHNAMAVLIDLRNISNQVEHVVSLGDSQPVQTAESSLRESALIEELTAVIEAGNMLAESIHYIQKEFDGIHRARLALANWYKVRANEYGRDKSSLSN